MGPSCVGAKGCGDFGGGDSVGGGSGGSGRVLWRWPYSSAAAESKRPLHLRGHEWIIWEDQMGFPISPFVSLTV